VHVSLFVGLQVLMLWLHHQQNQLFDHVGRSGILINRTNELIRFDIFLSSDFCFLDLSFWLNFLEHQPVLYRSSHASRGMADGIGTLHWIEQHLANIRSRITGAREHAHVPSTSSLITAVLIFALSGDASLAEYYLISMARRNGRLQQLVHVPRLDLEFMEALLDNQRIGRSVSMAFHNLSNRYRLEADKFLMNSLLADYVVQQNIKGVVITADTAIFQYLKLWSHRPVAERTRTWLLKLTHKVNARKRFGVRFRSEWALQFGALKVKKALDEGATRRKVLSVVTSGH
jgi:hypothetical protein